ncbi:MAG TPA: SGNH/GDSL hydrolase family protein [Solimonas sp.]|nr:SGNH/GDSL hydrolase family protein [Solimonas sp.]
MRHALATLGLGPVLLVQGRHVRRVTPRLPEAAGPREGVEGSGPALRLLVLGDSAAAGVGVETQSQALSGRLVAALAPQWRVEWKLVAHTGHTAQEVLTQLQQEPSRDFDIVITSTGVNDVTAGTTPRRWLEAKQGLRELLDQRFGGPLLLLSSLPPMQRFPALPQPLRWYLGLRAQRLNHALSTWAQARENCLFVPVGFTLQEGMMAADGFHPGAVAYAQWAEQLATLILRRLATG